MGQVAVAQACRFGDFGGRDGRSDRKEGDREIGILNGPFQQAIHAVAKLIAGFCVWEEVFHEAQELFEVAGPIFPGKVFGVSVAVLLWLGAFEEPGGGAPAFGGRGADRLQGVELGSLHGFEHLLVEGTVAGGGVADGGGRDADVACGDLLRAAGGEEGTDFGTFDVVEDGWAGHGDSTVEGTRDKGQEGAGGMMNAE